MKYTIEELRKIAEIDQGEDDGHFDRPWSYTDGCHFCGGVKGFIDWLENQPTTDGLKQCCVCKIPLFYSALATGCLRCGGCV